MFLRKVLMLLTFAAASPALTAEPAPVSALVKQVDIPHEQFTLANGLRVIVHTDRKAPVVAVSIWYHVGSKDETAGKTGFAHLFEHLMFNGSENAPGDYFEPLTEIGATDYNGTTWFDRTNYYQTVPTGALERVLFLESDRMGHLLGGVDQAKLDNQRAVVQNEKRQGDNEPFGQVDYVINHVLFPGGHPYQHQTIGSMADLNAASLTDVKAWFRARYGPDNAVLVLAGDIDARTARPLVEKWFGAFPRGPAIQRVNALPPTLPEPVTMTLTDQVPVTRVMRLWAVEGVNGKDAAALDVAASVLGGLSSSRLDNALVRTEKSAVAVTASVQPFEQIGILTVSADVKPGGDPEAVGKRVDQIIAELIKDGPTADEVRRVQTREIAGTIGSYESVSGKATALAEGLVYSGDADFYKKQLQDLAEVTPATARAAAQRWMSRPVFALTVKPGPRAETPEMLAITGDAPAAPPAAAAAAPEPVVKTVLKGDADRSKLPAIGQLASLSFPRIERAKLSNGIPVIFARRAAVPVVRVAVSFDAGYASDAPDALGAQSLMLSLIDEGTQTRDSRAIAEEQERLGATISTGASIDRSTVGLYAVKPNLAPSIALLADIVRNPAFAPAEVERLRAQQLSRIASQLSEPNGVANYVLQPLLYGPGHPYGVPRTGTGEAKAVAALSRDAIAATHRRWFRPDTAQIFAVGDTDLATLLPLLEANFGTWPSDRMARPVKDFAKPVPQGQSRVYLIDRPGSPQSVILGGQVLSARGRADDAPLVVLREANEVIGGQFLARLNMDLREDKGWSYGVQSGIPFQEDRPLFLVQAPVQTDQTGPSLGALIGDLKDWLGPKGTTQAERDRTVTGSIRELPGQFETSDAVLGAVQRITWFGRPDDFYEKLPATYRALTAADLDKAARAAIDPQAMRWVVVGDAAKVRKQLDAVGLPVEAVPSPAAK